MSKKKRVENLGVFIGLRAAHEILIKLTNKPESILHLEQEADTYSNLSFDLASGNWNKGDVERIRRLAMKRCGKKLERYEDIDDKKFDLVENVIEEIMVDLGLM